MPRYYDARYYDARTAPCYLGRSAIGPIRRIAIKRARATRLLLLAVTFLAACLAPYASFAGIRVLGLGTNELQTRRFAKRFQEASLIGVERKTFDDGNSGVRLLESVIHDDVWLVLPDVMSADELMESLITIRTLRANHAQSVTVSLSRPLDELVVRDRQGNPIEINVKRLFTAAGAYQVQEPFTRPIRLERTVPNWRPRDFSRSVIASASHVELRDAIAKDLGVPAVDSLSHSGWFNTQVFLLAAAERPVDENFIKTLAAIERLKSAGANVNLLMPYLFYARADKKDQFGIAINGKIAADLIEAAGADAVTFVRAHAPQSEGFFSIPTTQVSGRKTINAYLRKIGADVIVSPDAGFQKDASFYATELGLPLAVINKQREPVSGKAIILGISGESVAGKIVAIVDDETASGKTLADSAKFLKERGAKQVHTIVTHLNGSAAAALASPDIDFVVVTNTLPVKTEAGGKLVVLSIAAETADALRSLSRCERLLRGD